MSDEDVDPKADYIPRIRDAELRLDCFRVISQMNNAPLDFDITLAAAQRLYEWSMELESSTEEVTASSTDEDKCNVKH